MFGDFNFLSDLHFIVIVDFDFKVGRSDTPCNSADDFIECLQRCYPDSEVAC